MKCTGTDACVCVINTVDDVLRLDFINLTTWSFIVQIMDFTCIFVQYKLISIKWRIKSAHSNPPFYVLGSGGSLVQYKGENRKYQDTSIVWRGGDRDAEGGIKSRTEKNI